MPRRHNPREPRLRHLSGSRRDAAADGQERRTGAPTRRPCRGIAPTRRSPGPAPASLRALDCCPTESREPSPARTALSDFVDEEVAGLTRRTSKLGVSWDLARHGLIKTALFPALAYGVAVAETGRHLSLLAAIACVSMATASNREFYGGPRRRRSRTPVPLGDSPNPWATRATSQPRRGGVRLVQAYLASFLGAEAITRCPSSTCHQRPHRTPCSPCPPRPHRGVPGPSILRRSLRASAARRSYPTRSH